MRALAAWVLAIASLATPAAFAADAPPPGADAGARARPTAAQKRCLAATRRVERQLEVIADAKARTERERRAREACRTRRACDNLDRALKAAQARHARNVKQLEKFESEANAICATATGSR